MKIRYYMMLLVAFFATSCSKDLEVSGVPDFTVSAEKTTYRVGEEVNFNFEGNPGLISFYSGEIGHDYEYREGRIVPPGELSLSFTNSVNFGDQPKQFSVLVSTDFNGKYNIDDIKAASWTDITDRFTLATNATYISSGTVNISDLTIDGKPLYIVLRYIFDPAKGVGRTWSVRTFAVRSKTIFGEQQLADQNQAGFALYYFGPKEATGRSGITSTTITLRANATDKTVYTEDWCISQPFQVGSMDLGPDRPIAIKGNSDSKMTSYQYTYTKPGTYKVYFVASNASIQESKSVLKEIEITVVP